MANDLHECYRILDLAPGASQEEVKRAYRELVRVWHPDRFAHDPALQQKAQEKLTQINLAYDRICKGEADEPRAANAPAKNHSVAPKEGPHVTVPKQPSPAPKPPKAPLKERLIRLAIATGIRFTLVLFVALWALLEDSSSSLLTRCVALWTILGAVWVSAEIGVRGTPASIRAKWLDHYLPAEKPAFVASRRVFAAALGIVFLIAFCSWGWQVRGLVGERGLFPVSDQLAAGGSWWQTPSFCWIASGDTSLLLQCWLGAFLSLVLAAGVCPGACALLCWALYLSLMSVGESFANFQWDALLLETALLAALWLPWRPNPAWGNETYAQRIGRWLLWWLFFRLMIESGVVKLTWDDATWLDYSALDYHFETQPLPLWTAWYAHQAPRWMLRAACWITYLIEIATPALLFAPPRWRFLRHYTAIVQVLFQAAIFATGNYTYFNLLTIALCIPFLDDSFPLIRRPRKTPSEVFRPYWWTLGPAVALAIASVAWTFDGLRGAFAGAAGQEEEFRRLQKEYARHGHAPAPQWHHALRSFNGYGLFRSMTRSRPEIVLEGSADGINWHEYEFPYKAGDVYRRPALVAPHQPRLDWQMWFAALAPTHYSHLLERLLRRVLDAEPAVLGLLETNPFPEEPPRYVRLSFYDYHFTRFEDHSPAWWKRELRGSTQRLSLENFRKPATEK